MQVGDLIVGHRYLFRVRASNEAGPGAWSRETVYVPQPGVPVIRSAPELSSAEVGHVCVEWEAADNNGMDVTEYELEMAEPEAWRAEGKAPDKAPEGERAAEIFQAVQTHKLEGKQRVHHVKDLAINMRYLFRLRAVNAIGPSPVSSLCPFPPTNKPYVTHERALTTLGKSPVSLAHEPYMKAPYVTPKETHCPPQETH